MANRKKRTRKKDELLFQALAEGKMLREALAITGYGRSAVYRWRAEDEEFDARWKAAIDEAVELMEAEADRRAIEGVDEPVFYKGYECGYVRKFSDTLLIFRLKALAPEKYKERVENTGKDGRPIEYNVNILSIAGKTDGEIEEEIKRRLDS